MLGLVVLAGICISIFFAAYQSFRGLSKAERAKEAAIKLDLAIEYVIMTGNPHTVDVEIPEGYTLSFKENQLAIDGTKMPEGGYPWPIIGGNLSTGTHKLAIAIENGKIFVNEMI